jgi:hypothetical protein
MESISNSTDRRPKHRRIDMMSGRNSWFGLMLAFCLVTLFAFVALPKITPGYVPGPSPDSQDYAHLAAAILHGGFLVDYDGPPHLTRYTPGFPILLAPIVAIGGLESAVIVSYVAALVLGVLSALLAWRVGGGLAAPVATALVLFNAGVFVLAHIVMSDLPSAALAVSELALLSLWTGPRSAVAAGLIAGGLVWLRPGLLVMGAAGAVGLSASPRYKLSLAWYGAGLLLPVLLLGGWQWLEFGSPFVTSYQAAGASATGSSDPSGFFSLKYVLGPPWNTYSVGTEANGPVYLRALIGIDSDTTYPGIGLIGLIGAAVMALGHGEGSRIGRFSLAANAVTLLLYVPYFFRDLRFLIIPVVLNNILAAVVITRGIAALRSAVPFGRGPNAHRRGEV